MQNGRAEGEEEKEGCKGKTGEEEGRQRGRREKRKRERNCT